MRTFRGGELPLRQAEFYRQRVGQKYRCVAAWAGAGAGIWASPLTVDHYYLPLDRQPKYQVPSAECAPTPHPYSVKPIAAAGHTRAQGTHMRWQ